MVLLTTVGSTFEGRVLVARLGADGILAQLRGAEDGPYPLPGVVEVLVVADRADEARELLLADQVEAVYDDRGEPSDPTGTDPTRTDPAGD